MPETSETATAEAMLIKALAADVTEIRIGYALGQPLIAKRGKLGKWSVRHGHFAMREDLELVLKDGESDLELEDAISLGKSWINKHMRDGASVLEEKLSRILPRKDFSISIGMSDERLFDSEPPGEKPTILVHLKRALTLTEGVSASTPKSHWRVIYIPNSELYWHADDQPTNEVKPDPGVSSKGG